MTTRRVGWIGLDAPVELIAAAGCEPMRLDGDPAAAIGPAQVFAEGGGHPWMRATVDRLLAEADRMEAVVIGSMPVTGVWLYNFLISLGRGANGARLPKPYLVNVAHEERPSAIRLGRHSLGQLAEELGGVTTEALALAIAERNAVRRLQQRIEALRHGSEARLTGTEARRMLDAADVMDSAAYLSSAEAWLQAAASGPTVGGLPVIYSGPGSTVLDIYEALEAQGLHIVGDDADFGTRAIGPLVTEGDAPLAALAERYRRRWPAPAGWSTHERAAWLLDLIRARGAQAVVFDIPPYSHPAAWDFPVLRRRLEAEGVACVLAPCAPPAEAATAAAAALASGRSQEPAHV